MPPDPWTLGRRFTAFCVAESSITKAEPGVTNTSLPSGVNLRRLAPRALAARVAVTFFTAISITEIVPSPALATQTCLPSGETSNPSEPRPTGITVSFQSPPGGPGIGPGGIPGGGPDGESAPGGGPGGMPAGPSVFSRIVTVAAFTLVVTMRFASGNT